MPSELELSDVLQAFARAGELGRGLPTGHARRAAGVAARLAASLELPAEVRRDVVGTALLIHTGCTAGIAELAAFLGSDELAAQRDLWFCDPDNIRELLGWMRRHVAPEAGLPARVFGVLRMMSAEAHLNTEIEGGCSEVGARIAQRLGMTPATVESLAHACETWGGRGPRKAKGEAIPLPVRIVGTALIAEIFHAERGAQGAAEALHQRAGRSLDPRMANALAALCTERGLFDGEGALEVPAGAVGLDDVLLAFADLGDLKWPHSGAHARATAALAAELAVAVGLDDADVQLARRAALVHDVGHIAIPIAALEQPTSPVQRMLYAQHPDLGARILVPLPGTESIVKVAALHHERLDGSGFPGGVGAEALAMPARVVAVADAFREAIGDGPGEGLDPARALARVQAEALDPDVLAALATLVERSRERTSPDRPRGLTEREVEVLGLLARGRTNKQIGKALFVSPHTVRHHIEHIYEKIGVSTRAAATLFALEHDLVP